MMEEQENENSAYGHPRFCCTLPGSAHCRRAHGLRGMHPARQAQEPWHEAPGTAGQGVRFGPQYPGPISPWVVADGAALALIQELAPELIVVAAYGRILPDEILAAPPKGCINVHSSLLPKYRGAAPIHWAVLNGDSETGVTIMHMAHDLDAGDIIAQAATPIDPDETVVALHDRLAVLGAELLVNVVADIAAGTATRTPQEHGKATLAPMLSRELSPMDWSRPARALHNQVRGLVPWPAAVTELGGNRCKVFSTYWTPR